MNKKYSKPFIKILIEEYKGILRPFMYRYLQIRNYPDTVFGINCSISGNCSFEEGVNIERGTELSSSHFGRYTSVGPYSRFRYCKIGSFCSLGPQVIAGLGRHPIDYVSTSPAFYSPYHSTVRIIFTSTQEFNEHLPIEIGSDVWIGARAVILDGVSIGHGAIIGSGAVVTKNVDPYSIVGGVPAKFIKLRFEEKYIQKLLEIKWWDRSLDWIKSHSIYFLNIDDFINQIDSIKETDDTR